MALSCLTQIAFRGARQSRVVQAICDHLPGHDAFVSPRLNGWISVFDADCDSWQDIEDHNLRVGIVISRTCKYPGIALALGRHYRMSGVLNDLGMIMNKPGPEHAP